MSRFWVYLENKVQGPIEIPALRKLNNFNLLTQVCAEGQESWRMADDVIEIKSYFSSPPRVSSLLTQTQTLPKELENPEPMTAEQAAIETLPDEPAPTKLEMVLPTDSGVETGTGPSEAVHGDPAKSAALRVTCAVCGYKNPRDVKICMQCATPLQSPNVETLPDSTETVRPLHDSQVVIAPDHLPDTPSPADSPTPGPMVEIPIARILIILLCASLVGALSFVGYRSWKKYATHKTAKKMAAVTPVQPLVKNRTSTHSTKKRHRASSHYRSTSARAPSSRSHVNVDARLLPGISTKKQGTTSAKTRSLKSNFTPVESNNDGYELIPQARPLNQRMHAPVNSPYATKTRKDTSRWAGREDEAIQLTHGRRIYGGLRTVLRNSEILFQILRDREYTSAFESGKRLTLYNDMDWGAIQKEGPLYEVHLTFTGGKETDGSPRKPLRFNFDVDLERQTVQPGLNASTMHGFFDESRIPPEERTQIAKDTEELVLAAQPGGSPLALQTVVHHFVTSYSETILNRVVDAYGLNDVDKAMARDVHPSKETPEAEKTASKTVDPAFAIAKKPSRRLRESDLPQCEIQRGNGKERLVHGSVQSHGTISRLWELATSYDRFSQFVPDILVSQREGQDGNAIVVQTVSLTRVLFFVFKINLHLRIIEHPSERMLEFERIAGDFESFKGTLAVKSEMGNPNMSTIVLNATLIPRGYTPDWIIRAMTQRAITTALDALRNKAEN